jgi:hypothetical protein
MQGQPAERRKGRRKDPEVIAQEIIEKARSGHEGAVAREIGRLLLSRRQDAIDATIRKAGISLGPLISELADVESQTAAYIADDGSILSAILLMAPIICPAGTSISPAATRAFWKSIHEGGFVSHNVNIISLPGWYSLDFVVSLDHVQRREIMNVAALELEIPQWIQQSMAGPIASHRGELRYLIAIVMQVDTEGDRGEGAGGDPAVDDIDNMQPETPSAAVEERWRADILRKMRLPGKSAIGLPGPFSEVLDRSIGDWDAWNVMSFVLGYSKDRRFAHVLAGEEAIYVVLVDDLDEFVDAHGVALSGAISAREIIDMLRPNCEALYIHESAASMPSPNVLN